MFLRIVCIEIHSRRACKSSPAISTGVVKFLDLLPRNVGLRQLRIYSFDCNDSGEVIYAIFDNLWKMPQFCRLYYALEWVGCEPLCFDGAYGGEWEPMDPVSQTASRDMWMTWTRRKKTRGCIFPPRTLLRRRGVSGSCPRDFRGVAHTSSLSDSCQAKPLPRLKKDSIAACLADRKSHHQSHWKCRYLPVSAEARSSDKETSDQDLGSGASTTRPK